MEKVYAVTCIGTWLATHGGGIFQGKIKGCGDKVVTEIGHCQRLPFGDKVDKTTG